ncbi:hypothetical protein KIPB_011207 [Kipferlia bialata]|uniref:Uncharacterized protein n=1 Tax=Kipferlia bialata TaxID=797122 RepID=A0A9K3D4D5_9EUKA|nr:hypothetical protein KIPB_011207 [Kipferlia bialata]|eukprot:g11207.t1
MDTKAPVLDLSGQGITVDTFPTLLDCIFHWDKSGRPIYLLTHVTELNLSGNALNLQCTQRLTNVLPGLPRLTSLSVSNCGLDTSVLLSNLAQVAKGLKVLNIADNSYHVSCRQHFRWLSILPLEKLDMGGLGLDDK